MGRRCCCTVAGCEIGIDAFNRSDSINIGTDWTELSGEWEIADNELHCTADGIALWVKRHLSAKQYPSFVISVDLPNVVVGCVYGIIANSNLTGTDYYWAKYTPSTPGAGQLGGTLAIGKGATTIDLITLDPISTSSPNVDRLTMCIGEHPHGDGNGILSAALQSYDQAVWDSDVSVINYYGYCGLYGEPADENTPAEFDNFSASEGWWSNQECPKCLCRCYIDADDHRVLPMTLKLIWHVEGDNQTLIGCYDLVEVTLTWDDAAAQWQGELDPNPCAASCSGSGFDGATIPFFLECDTETLTGHRLQVDLSPEGNSVEMYPGATSTCLPLSLIFSYLSGTNVACEEDEDNSTIWFEVVDGT